MNKKIAIMTTSLKGGGAKKVVSNISLHICDCDLPIMLLYDEAIDYDYCGKLVILPNKKTKNKFKKVFQLFRRIAFLKKFKRDNNIDMTFSLLSKPNLYNIISRTKDKIIISIRSYEDVASFNEVSSNDRLRWKFIKTITKHYYRKSDLIIAVSMPIRDKLISGFGVDPNKIKVIYNPLDIDSINFKSKESLPEEHLNIIEGTVFITAGRLEIEKGQYHLIRAFSEVKKKITGAKLIILGKGSLKDDLENLAVDLEISDSVIFLNHQSNPYKYLSKASIFVLSSLWEGFPNVITEALACGLPVISTNCISGPCEIMSTNASYEGMSDFKYEEYGVLCPVCDGIFRKADTALTDGEIVLANAITSLACDEKRREEYRKKGIERAKNFDIESIMDEYTRTFEEVLQG